MMKYIEGLRWWFLNEIVAIPGRLIAFVFVVALFFIPAMTQAPFFMNLFVLANIYALYAVSWDLLAGFAGQFSFGHSAFFGVAAYTAALLNINLRLPPWLTIPVGALVAVGIGLVVALPALRLRGIYLSLVTVAFPTILMSIVFAFPDFTGGELGIFGVKSLTKSTALNYYVILAIVLISVASMWKITDIKSKILRTGVVFRAIREDEIAARLSGINTTRYKVLAFAVSAFFAGIAGGLYAHVIRVAGPSTLEFTLSFNALLYTIFGGIGTIYGPIVGTYILHPLTYLLGMGQMGQEIRMIVWALVMVLALLFMPEGISQGIRERIEVHCPRCGLSNAARRELCRVCGANLHLERTAKEVEA